MHMQVSKRENSIVLISVSHCHTQMHIQVSRKEKNVVLTR